MPSKHDGLSSGKDERQESEARLETAASWRRSRLGAAEVAAAIACDPAKNPLLAS